MEPTTISSLPIRRSDIEPVVVGGMRDGIRRYYDENLERTIVKLITGDCYISEDPNSMLVTILGSCISVCMRDPISQIGGMNHFLLPGDDKKKDDHGLDYPTRFGAFAMESLINGILSKGGNRGRLEAKVFGGGNVIDQRTMIGSSNVTFVKSYLERENIYVAAEHVGGEHPRRIHYFPDSGKVRMRLLKRKEDFSIVEEEVSYRSNIERKKETTTDIELFD